MTSKKVRSLKETVSVIRNLKDKVVLADIYELENLTGDNYVKSATYGGFSKSSVPGIVDNERKVFYSFEDDAEFPIKKSNLTEKLNYDSYDESDVGNLFVINIKRDETLKFTVEEICNYSYKYLNYLKRINNNESNKKKVYK